MGRCIHTSFVCCSLPTRRNLLSLPSHVSVALASPCRYNITAWNSDIEEQQRFGDYDAVVIACPLEACAIDLKELQTQQFLPVHLREYKQVVVTFVKGQLKPGVVRDEMPRIPVVWSCVSRRFAVVNRVL
jgi:hypothetical protein